MTQTDKYSNTWSVSQSSLKSFLKMSPSAWYKKYIERQVEDEPDKDYFIFGSICDLLAFSPKEYDNRFVVMEEQNLPSEGVRQIIDKYYNDICSYNDDQYALEHELPEITILDLHLNHDKYLLNAIKADSWQPNWKDDTKLAKIKEAGKGYFNSLIKASGRKIISQQDKTNADTLIDILRTHPISKDYFVQAENEELIFQLEIYETFESVYGNIPIKGALDIVRLKHKNKTAQIADFKTSYSAFEFKWNIKKLGYHIQLSFYMFLLKLWLQSYKEGIYKDYKIIEPCNIVIDVVEKLPYKYMYKLEDMYDIQNGRNLTVELDGAFGNTILKEITGWVSVLDEISWHFNQQSWSFPKEMYENNYILVDLD